MAATDVRTALSEQKKSQQKQSWLGMTKDAGSEWVEDDAMTWAAAIACYTLLAIAPMLVIAVKVGTILLGGGNAPEKIRNQAQNWMGSDAAGAIATILDKVVHQGGGLVASIVSGVLVIVSVGGVFAEIQQAMNRVWKVKPKPKSALWAFVKARLKSVVVLGIAAVILIASVVVSGWIGTALKSMGMQWKWISVLIDVVASIAVLTLIFAMVYRVVPDANIEWRTTWVGALLTAILFAIGKWGLTLYFKFGTPTSAFGAVGSLAAVLIWIYYSAQISLYGAEFTQVYAKARGHGVRPAEHAQFLSECNETETATPSQEEPQNKPDRPSGRKSPAMASNYSDVLGRHVPAFSAGPSAELDPQAVHEQMVVRNVVVAGASLVVGALIGGFSAVQMRQRNRLRGKDIAAVHLDQRMKHVEHKLGRVSRIKEYLEQENVNERIDHLEKEIRQAAAKARHVSRRTSGPNGKWAGRIVQAVKSYL